MAQTQESAEATALQILTWLAGHDEILSIFQGATGVSEADLRSGAHDPVFLAAVLDFVLMDDAWVVQACDAHGLDYAAVQQARRGLPGGQEINWT